MGLDSHCERVLGGRRRRSYEDSYNQPRSNCRNSRTHTIATSRPGLWRSPVRALRTGSTVLLNSKLVADMKVVTPKSIFSRLATVALGSLCALAPVLQISVLSAGPSEGVKRQSGDADSVPVDSRPLKLISHRVVLSKTKKFNLYLPPGFEITVAAQGLKRARFIAKSPDNRIFVTDMYNRTDNQKGAVYILDGFDAGSGKFSKVTTYLKGLRNPNSIAFHTDPQGIHWFYLALTDRLLRYRYTAGEAAPSSEPEAIATFPDYGLNYKYGGWHLTRTIAIGAGKLYVSVGSSCNACVEAEPIRATVLEMDLDGKNQRVFASGLRNAVGLKWVQGQLFVTNMGADHLGDFKPDDTMYVVEANKNYGWPFCFQYRKRMYADAEFSKSERKIDCGNVPPAYVGFSAHSSPLGFEYFDSSNDSPALKDSLVYYIFQKGTT